MKEYDTFVLRNEVLPDGGECRIIIRDLTPGRDKYKSLTVKALVASSAELMPDGDTLWVRNEVGALSKDPWKIKILEGPAGA